jgi:hypothetical protein
MCRRTSLIVALDTFNAFQLPHRQQLPPRKFQRKTTSAATAKFFYQRPSSHITHAEEIQKTGLSRLARTLHFVITE